MCSTGGTSMASPLDDETSASQDTPPKLSGDISPEHRDSIHAIACITCSTRKVKCDRVDPACSNCIKSNLTCEYRAPLPRGPRKRKYLPDEDLHARLERYEELLRACGIPDPASASTAEKSNLAIRDMNPGPPTGFKRMPRGDGKVVTNERGKPRYIENKLWDVIAEEIPHDQDDEEEDDFSPSANGFTPGSMATSQPHISTGEGALLLGSYTLTNPGQGWIDPKSQYLTPEQTTAMLDVFCSNVHPLTKLVHLPTLTPRLKAAVANPATAERKLDALIHSMMFCAANTLSNQECQDIFYIERRVLLDNLQDTTSKALVAADILRSDDIEVLQAFAFFLLAMRERLDLRTTWMLTGNAVRMAMAMGLHRSGAFESHFSLFQQEYRRRLWWQVAVLDARVGELAGFGASPLIIESDAKSPSAYNDDDIHPDMKELPPQRTGCSECLFVTTRSAVRDYGRRKGLGPAFLGIGRLEMSIDELEERVRELELLFEQNILRYCDPLEPLHVLVSAMARTVVHRMRLKAYHPGINKAAENLTLSQKEQDICFNSALKNLEYDNLIFGSNNLRCFHWHVRAHFQWDALIYILTELRSRGHDDITAKAWKQVETCFKCHPEFIEETRKPLNLAVSNLCLKAWVARETAQAAASPTGTHPPPPRFIEAIREKQAKRKTPSPSMPLSDEVLSEAQPLFNQPDFAEFANVNFDPNFWGEGVTGGLGMDWHTWNDTLQYHEPNLEGLPWMK